MALNAERFTRTTLAFNSGGSTLGDSSNVNGPSAFTYATATDDLATVAAANYFNAESVVYDLQVDDLITCVCSDGGQMLRVATVDATSNPKTITTVVFVSGGGSGAYVEDTRAIGSAISLTTATQTNIASISLPPGEWLVFGAWHTALAATTTSDNRQGAISEVNATIPDAVYVSKTVGSLTGTTDVGLAAPSRRLSLAVTTIIYLVTYVEFAVSTASAFGYIAATKIG